jgi:hypothetical protein
LRPSSIGWSMRAIPITASVAALLAPSPVVADEHHLGAAVVARVGMVADSDGTAITLTGNADGVAASAHAPLALGGVLAAGARST